MNKYMSLADLVNLLEPAWLYQENSVTKYLKTIMKKIGLSLATGSSQTIQRPMKVIRVHLSRTRELLPGEMRILRRCQTLVNEMIHVVSQLSIALEASSLKPQDREEIPSLATAENCMKLLQIIVQALQSKTSPIQQLPHMSLGTKMSIPELISMEEGERRDTFLSHLTDEQYQDVISACSHMPNVEMGARSEVNEDGTAMTVIVSIARKNMLNTAYEYRAQENAVETNQTDTYFGHCPYFPDERQEGWWLYVADLDNKQLVTKPVLIVSLLEEIRLRISAPKEAGCNTNSIKLTSDSYFGLDKHLKLKLIVQY
ncbi:hypothetical protein DPMN_109296 [Dreissena polymorpha]|uniref:SEC63 domain-containing protein n=2 Tax=Dreissena polymorpha TaxID=45954 RepID=A0A9D4KA08_DREPO|nr:hypothetical protein DPMN_109296 [Dreissena polymorpha]